MAMVTVIQDVSSRGFLRDSWGFLGIPRDSLGIPRASLGIPKGFLGDCSFLRGHVMSARRIDCDNQNGMHLYK